MQKVFYLIIQCCSKYFVNIFLFFNKGLDMRMNYCAMLLSVSLLFSSGVAYSSSVTPRGGFFVNYNWMNAVVNKTPVVPSACPTVETDIYGNGFKVARQKSFYGNIMGTLSKWFPKDKQWASVGVGPTKSSFGIYFTDIDQLKELSQVKEKRLPDNFNEINKWKVSDSAYWESQGGVSFYLGTGIVPFTVGIFAVATGGWVNFLQKTGPHKVYVEISRKKVKSISLNGGAGIPANWPIRYPGLNVSVGKAFEKSKGFSYEFNLDSPENIEAFERFMAGDMTKAQELSMSNASGITKISDITDSRVGTSIGFGITIPYIPIFSFKTSIEHGYDVMEEDNTWNEVAINNSGVYIKQRNVFLAGHLVKTARSFTGGKTLKDAPDEEGGMSHTEKIFGNFKYSYQSNWGQERRLRKYLRKVKELTGLVSETCVKVPSFKDSLGFNQIDLQLDLSDEYLREIIGVEKTKSNLLQKIKTSAQNYQMLEDNLSSSVCQKGDLNDDGDDDSYDESCRNSSSEKISNIFKNLEEYSLKMNQTIDTDRKQFAKYLAKFGEEIWKSPFVFKAFYEKGKICGERFKFEVSGQRISRHFIDQQFVNTPACSKL